MEATKRPPLPPALYVNYLRIAHHRSEFFLAFGQTMQESGGGAHLVASLVTSPGHAKAMLRALAQAVERHEARFGEIPPVEPPLGVEGEGVRPGASSAGRRSTPLHPPSTNPSSLPPAKKAESA